METVSNTMEKVIEFATVIHPADENVSYNPDRTRFVPIFAKIQYSADGRLSISGVVGPRENGNCAGSCGQIVMSFKEYDKRGHMTLNELREQAGLDIGEDGLCAVCDARLTEADVDAGECTQCRTTIDTIDDKGESE